MRLTGIEDEEQRTLTAGCSLQGLSLPVDRWEDEEIFVKGLATDFLKEGLADWRIREVVEADDLELEEEDEIGFSYD
ncbi:hypothetical protein HOY82DRAFT_603333 [Tuber indicum]|nr:hypothetical protein HOY82DRAFT_603333 [Tuber indicum]